MNLRMLAALTLVCASVAALRARAASPTLILLDGYFVAWNANVTLPRQVEWATMSTSSGVIAPQRQDGTADAATYLANGDMFCGPNYSKAQAFPIGWPLPQGCYALSLSAGVWSFPVNATYSGYGPVYPYPIH